MPPELEAPDEDDEAPDEEEEAPDEDDEAPDEEEELPDVDDDELPWLEPDDAPLEEPPPSAALAPPSDRLTPLEAGEQPQTASPNVSNAPPQVLRLRFIGHLQVMRRNAWVTPTA